MTIRMAWARTRVPWLIPSGLGILLVAGWLIPSGWTGPDLTAARRSPSWAHFLGTNYAGQDLGWQILLGVQVSLMVALTAAVTACVIGTVVGTLAATVGGWVDGLLMRFTDGISALPHLLMGIVIVALYPGSLVAIIASIALLHWPQVARIVRTQARQIRSSEYVELSYLAGASRWQVLVRHMLPAVATQVGVALVALVPHAVFHESTLSFLGMGLSPDRASLGTLLAQARGDIQLGAWWSLVFPGTTLVALTLAVYLLTRRWSSHAAL